MSAVNGSMPPPLMHPNSQVSSENSSGPFGDPAQLPNNMASMHISQPGLQRHPGPPASHPPGMMHAPPGPGIRPPMSSYPSNMSPTNTASLSHGPPIMSNSSNGGPLGRSPMAYNPGQLPPSPDDGSPMYSQPGGPPHPMTRGSSPPYAPPNAGHYAGKGIGPTPPMSGSGRMPVSSLPPTMSSNSMGMSAGPMPPTMSSNSAAMSGSSVPPPMPSNVMGMPGNSMPPPPMPNTMNVPGSSMAPPMSNAMGMSGSSMPPPPLMSNAMGMPGSSLAPTMPSNAAGVQAGTMPPPVSSNAMRMPGNIMPPPLASNAMSPPGGLMPPSSSGTMGLNPAMQPYNAPGMMLPHSTAGSSQHTPGGPMPSGLSQPMPNSSGQSMMPPPPPGGSYGSAPHYGGGPGAPYAGPAGSGMAPQPQARRLDPDHMPSVIQVIANDNQQRSGVFSTAQRGVTPPLVTTDFVVQDHGNASPRFMRSTLYNVPANSDLLKQMAVPFVLNITPFARLHEKENPVPISDMGPQGPVRCNRCKAYMSGFMTFIDGGRRFQCALCGGCSDVPVEYFAHLDHTGRRVDCSSRPELWAGSYELMATTEYCKGNKLPEPPAFIFMLDVSYNSVKSGLAQLFCQRLKTEILPNLPRERFPDGTESEPRVGFATYDKNVHFYNLKPCLSQPQMQVVSDMEDVFVPLVDGFLVNPAEADTLVDLLMDFIPNQFSETRQTETVLGPAIRAGMEALIAANCSGKLFVFHTSLPIAEAPGKLKNRDDRKLLGTEKEKTILSPSTQYYTKLGEECVSAGCSVDLFVFPNSYIDLATISEVPKLTGGNLYKYTYFQADLHGEQFIADLSRAVALPVAFDSVMRVRTSAGTRPVDFYGHLYMSNTTDVECAAFDSDKAVSMEIKHDDKLTDGDLVYIQAAILYTSLGGQRRLRIHNLALSVSASLIDLFRAAELDTLSNFILKHSLRLALTKTPKDVRESIANQCATILTCYRKNCAQTSNVGQLILPEGMKLLPLYCNCIIKNDALQGGSDISTDDRSYLMFLVGSLNVVQSQNFLYPRLLPLHSLDTNAVGIPQAVRASIDRLLPDGAYLLENGFYMFMWIGQNVGPDFLQSVFGVQTAAEIDVEKPQLLEFDNPLSQRVRQIVSQVRVERGRRLRLILVRQHDKLEHWFKHFMVEDRGENGSTSYVDFLCHIHKEIRTLMS